MSMDEVRKKRNQIIALAARHRMRNLRIFGSLARGEAGPGSDVDLLVELEPGSTLLDHAAMVRELEALLGCRVDVVSERALRQGIAPRVLKEAVPL